VGCGVQVIEPKTGKSSFVMSKPTMGR
jgi:hypothetical protein